MKTNRMKIIMISGAAATVLVAAVVLLVLNLGKKTDPMSQTYREVRVYELEGKAEVERASAGKLEAYQNMQLMDQDLISVLEKSALYLKMDEDKYGMLSENSLMSIQASGTARDSRTKLHLETGTFTCHIKNKLSVNSSFEITTPNSTMAVRGTSFRIEVWRDEFGDVYTKVTVFEGKLEVHLVYPDGSVEKEAVYIEKGTEVIIHMDESISEYLTEEKINYNVIDKREFTFLYVYDEEDIYSIPKEELEEIIHSATVTFTYHGNVFGTQRVRIGSTPKIPSMQPAANGKWDYDFTKVVEGDIEIPWMD